MRVYFPHQELFVLKICSQSNFETLHDDEDGTLHRNEKHVHYDGYDKRVNSDDGKIMCSA